MVFCGWTWPLTSLLKENFHIEINNHIILCSKRITFLNLWFCLERAEQLCIIASMTFYLKFNMYSVFSWFKAAKNLLSLLILVAPVDTKGIGTTAFCQNDLYLARLCICAWKAICFRKTQQFLILFRFFKQFAGFLTMGNVSISGYVILITIIGTLLLVQYLTIRLQSSFFSQAVRLISSSEHKK